MLKFAIAMIGAEVVFAATMGLGGYAMAQPSQVTTVDGTDYPVCSLEDCSDQPNQVGVWIDPDTGTAWLSLGERSYRVTP